MKVLVTGGAGYIGSHASHQLIDEGNEVIILDNLSTGNREAINPKAKFYEGDQRDSELLDKIFSENKIDVVMHFSAKLVVPESVEKPIFYFENNVHGVAKLLEGMKKAGVKNIIFSSTAAIYGQPDTLEPITEDYQPNPINPYGESKLACEWLIKSASKAYGLNYVIFRYFNVAGAREDGQIGLSAKGDRKLTHLIPVVVETGLKDRDKMEAFGNDFPTKDGYGVRDYIHVEDLARAHILGAKYAFEGNSNIFNLGSGTGFSVLEIVKAVEKELKDKINWHVGPRRAGDPASLIANNSKATKFINFKTKHSLEKIIKDDINWRKNKRF